MRQPLDIASAVTCVIPTYNSGAVIERCLRSIPLGVLVVVADNASSDDTTAVARTVRPDAKIVILERNWGFGQACNAGAALAGTPYVTFVNPDLVIGAAALDAIVETAEAYPQIAVLGSADSIESQVAAWPVADVEMVSGAFLTVRRSAFSGKALFDPNFFMYFEDFDLCVRAVQAGQRVVVVRAAAVDHAQGQSTAVRFDNELEKAWLWGGSCRYFSDKHATSGYGAKATQKLRKYWRKALFYRIIGQQRLVSFNQAKVEGAALVERCGPDAMHRNGFTTGIWRTAHLSTAE
jgi:N-acetylglucosaminyl-diphospho-decaprenol L-rhamnosyltransferase